MIIKLLTEHHLEVLSLTGGCTDSSESTHVKMPHCWKSHVTAQIYFKDVLNFVNVFCFLQVLVTAIASFQETLPGLSCFTLCVLMDSLV